MAAQAIAPKRSTPLLKGTLKNLFFPPEKDEYEYFSRAQSYPFAQGDTIVKAGWAADAAMLSYARYGAERMDGDELERNLERGGLKLEMKIGEDPNNWNSPGTQAFFATGDNFAILAFRGTEVDDPADARADLDILLVSERDYKGAPAPPVLHLSLFEDLLSMPCLVHEGFQSALNRVWDKVYGVVSAYREKFPQGEICVTGHSLGGALALLTYSRFADPCMSAYTIGCPRIGNRIFRSRVADNPGKGHCRIVNCNDLVAHIPPESAFYLHAPEECYRIDESGMLSPLAQDTLSADLTGLAALAGGLPADLTSNSPALERPAPPSLVDHSPARYCMRVWDCV
jgi:Lipase (class 3)